MPAKTAKRPSAGAGPATAVALIPGAGIGARFHDDGPKALVRLAGKPFLLHALERLARSGRVQAVVVAGTPGYEEAFRDALASSPLPATLVTGGVTRRESVTNAFAAADPADGTLVLVHDAVRPLVDPAEVAAVVDAAAAHGAAIAACSMVDTVKRKKGGRIVETVSREELVAATTPQVFEASLFRKALARTGGAEVTDDAELVERAGGSVAVVLTSRWNIKITYPEDLEWAEAFLARGSG